MRFHFSPSPNQPVAPSVMETVEDSEHGKRVAELSEARKSLEWNLVNREPSASGYYVGAVADIKKKMEENHITEAEYEAYFEKKKQELH